MLENPKTHTRRILVAALAAIFILPSSQAAASLTLPLPQLVQEAESSNAGRVKYRIDAASYFDPFAGEETWIKNHVSVIKAYATFGDRYVRYGLPVVSYHDPATEGFSPLTPSSIESYVSKVKRDAGVRYAGAFIDDVNWSAGFRDGGQSRSLEPEKHELADLIEAVRAAIPTGVIEINSQYHDIWPLIKSNDPDVARALAKVNVVTKEFGVGPTAGIDTASDYAEFMRFIDALHAKGIHPCLTGDYGPGGTTVAVMEYNLATYFLVNDGRDFVNGVNQTPSEWWSGFDVALGAAYGSRQRSSSGVWTRQFLGGEAITVEPGASTQTIRLGRRMHSAEWGTVESVTLSAGQGAVLVG